MRRFGFESQRHPKFLWIGVMEKFCGSCQTVKNVSEFNKNRVKSDGLSTKCKSCNRAYLKDHYLKNKVYYAEKRENTKTKYRKIFYDYLIDKSCIDCGMSDIRVLEFDHREDKSFNISSKMAYMPLVSLMAEIEKCDIVCANCHRIRTGYQLNWYKKDLLSTSKGSSEVIANHLLQS